MKNHKEEQVYDYIRHEFRYKGFNVVVWIDSELTIQGLHQVLVTVEGAKGRLVNDLTCSKELINEGYGMYLPYFATLTIPYYFSMEVES